MFAPLFHSIFKYVGCSLSPKRGCTSVLLYFQVCGLSPVPETWMHLQLTLFSSTRYVGCSLSPEHGCSPIPFFFQVCRLSPVPETWVLPHSHSKYVGCPLSPKRGCTSTSLYLKDVGCSLSPKRGCSSIPLYFQVWRLSPVPETWVLPHSHSKYVSCPLSPKCGCKFSPTLIPCRLPPKRGLQSCHILLLPPIPL